jgi:hypothetical protein
MTLTRVARWLTLGIAAGAAWIGLSTPAQAIPVFARQTGHNCQACHISFPELTAYGREFKLNGYTFGEAQPFPIAVAAMASYTHVNDNTEHSSGTALCSGCDHGHVDQTSFFFGGRITDNIGLFGQYSYHGDGVHASGMDNTELRVVGRSTPDGALQPNVVYGLLINNNITMQDVWQTVPAWEFPWFPETQAGFGPLASKIYDGLGQRAVGIGAYAWTNKTWYTELTLYRSPYPMFGWLVNGNTANGNATTLGGNNIKGYAPYARVAYSRDWGYSSLEIGAYGLQANIYSGPNAWNPSTCDPNAGCGTPGGLTDNFSDWAIDAQYQFNKNEPWIVSAAATYNRESKTFDQSHCGNVPGSVANNCSSAINEFQIKGTAYYDRTYGVTLAYNNYSGTKDALLYQQGSPGGSATGSPSSSFWTLELNYVPLQDMRFTLNYTKYSTINGGSANFDGMGNNAAGQNTLWGAIWWAF